LVEDKENLLLEIDKLEKPLLPLILLLIRKNISIEEMLINNYIVFMLQLDKKDPLLPISSKLYMILVLYNILLLLLLPLLKLPLFNF